MWTDGRLNITECHWRAASWTVETNPIVVVVVVDEMFSLRIIVQKNRHLLEHSQREFNDQQ